MSLIVLIIIAGLAYWFLFMRQSVTTTSSNTTSTDSTFSPFNKNGKQGTSNPNNSTSTNASSSQAMVVPSLRLLSSTPIGGYGASTTARTTFVRWIDRGRGNILEATEGLDGIDTLSNTLLPKTYDSVWSKDLSGFIGTILGDDDQTVSTLFASITLQATSSSDAPYQLRGKNLPDGIVSYASSPKKDKVLLFVIQNGQGIGYVAPFNGGTAVQIFSTPITQVNVEWPEDNTIAITTKGSAADNGFLYFVNPKTGVWKKILGPVAGLSTKVSHDAKYVLFSATDGSDGLLTAIYSVASTTSSDAVIKTLADKCAWGNFYKEVVYCAVPFKPVSGTYPDDWYRGNLSTVDKMWQLNAKTGEIHLVSSIFTEAKRNIDAYKLDLDSKDNYLFFINKGDLSFWSLDLVTAK